MDAQNDLEGNSWEESTAADAEVVKRSKQMIPGDQLSNESPEDREKTESLK